MLIAAVDRAQIDNIGGGGSGGGGSTACDPATCPPPASECMDAVCNPDGTCDEAPKADGTPLNTQTDGDCKQAVCEAGEAVDADDDTR